jgi:hypothetical protein
VQRTRDMELKALVALVQHGAKSLNRQIKDRSGLQLSHEPIGIR